MGMTWKEFKEFVDRNLSDANATENIEISYIDTGNGVDKNMGIYIDKNNNSLSIDPHNYA